MTFANVFGKKISRPWADIVTILSNCTDVLNYPKPCSFFHLPRLVVVGDLFSMKRILKINRQDPRETTDKEADANLCSSQTLIPRVSPWCLFRDTPAKMGRIGRGFPMIDWK